MIRTEEKKTAVRRIAPALAAAAVLGAGAITLAVNNVAAQDAKAGETAFVRCRVCHTVEKGEPNRVGPNLFGVIGRTSGTVAGFMYSDAMKNAKITWSNDTLDKYIQDPPGTVPGNRMQLAKGAVNAQQAKDIIAFLNTKK